MTGPRLMVMCLVGLGLWAIIIFAVIGMVCVGKEVF